MHTSVAIDNVSSTMSKSRVFFGAPAPLFMAFACADLKFWYSEAFKMHLKPSKNHRLQGTCTSPKPTASLITKKKLIKTLFLQKMNMI